MNAELENVWHISVEARTSRFAGRAHYDELHSMVSIVSAAVGHLDLTRMGGIVLGLVRVFIAKVESLRADSRSVVKTVLSGLRQQVARPLRRPIVLSSPASSGRRPTPENSSDVSMPDLDGLVSPSFPGVRNKRRLQGVHERSLSFSPRQHEEPDKLDFDVPLSTQYGLAPAPDTNRSTFINSMTNLTFIPEHKGNSEPVPITGPDGREPVDVLDAIPKLNYTENTEANTSKIVNGSMEALEDSAERMWTGQLHIPLRDRVVRPLAPENAGPNQDANQDQDQDQDPETDDLVANIQMGYTLPALPKRPRFSHPRRDRQTTLSRDFIQQCVDSPETMLKQWATERMERRRTAAFRRTIDPVKLVGLQWVPEPSGTVAEPAIYATESEASDDEKIPEISATHVKSSPVLEVGTTMDDSMGRDMAPDNDIDESIERLFGTGSSLPQPKEDDTHMARPGTAMEQLDQEADLSFMFSDGSEDHAEPRRGEQASEILYTHLLELTSHHDNKVPFDVLADGAANRWAISQTFALVLRLAQTSRITAQQHEGNDEEILLSIAAPKLAGQSTKRSGL